MSRIRVLAVLVLGLSAAACSAGSPTEPAAAAAPPTGASLDVTVCSNGGMMGSSGKC
jgi:hypothetical protein